MKLINFLKRFKKDEDGAVTVDWVVLTAAVVGLGIVVMGFIKDNVSTLSEKIGEEISEAGTGLGSGS
jgi:Flp pilus assembly pilin Flp